MAARKKTAGPEEVSLVTPTGTVVRVDSELADKLTKTNGYKRHTDSDDEDAKGATGGAYETAL